MLPETLQRGGALGTGPPGRSLIDLIDTLNELDAAGVALVLHQQREECELNPAGSISGPEVYRTVHQVEQGYPVVLMREYTVSRDKLAGVLALISVLQRYGPVDRGLLLQVGRSSGRRDRRCGCVPRIPVHRGESR